MNTKVINGKDKKELKLGWRKVSAMNFSKVVTLPKTFTDNYLDKNMIVQMTLTPDGKLVLSPVRQDESRKVNESDDGKQEVRA